MHSRHRWNELRQNQKEHLLGLSFIPNLEEWSKKQTLIEQILSELFLEEATICHVSHIGQKDVSLFVCPCDHLDNVAAFTVGHFLLGLMLLMMVASIWNAAPMVQFCGQIKGHGNNAKFMESHHGSRQKCIPLCLHFIFKTHSMCKQLHAWVFTETSHSSGFVWTFTPMCVDHREDNC